MRQLPVASYKVFEMCPEHINGVPCVKLVKQTLTKLPYSVRYHNTTFIECQPNTYCSIYDVQVKAIRGKSSKNFKCRRDGIVRQQNVQTINRRGSVAKMVGGYNRCATNTTYQIMGDNLVIYDSNINNVSIYKIIE